MNPCLLIQGQDTFIDKLSLYKNNDVIFSTWEGNRSNFNHTIRLMPPIDPGYGNSNLQFFGWWKGVECAKVLGFDYVLKIRADLEISDYKKLLSLLDPDSLSFLAYHDWDGGYLVDYIIGGPVDIIEKISSDLYFNHPHNKATEKQIMDTLKKANVSEVQYILPLLRDNNITCYSHKWERDLTKSMLEDPLFIFPLLIN